MEQATTRSAGGFKVVVAGGGVAALEAALTLAQVAANSTVVNLLAPEPNFWYRPASVAEPFGLGTATHVELTKLAAAANATFTLGSIESVDGLARKAYAKDGTAYDYDALLIACGAKTRPVLGGALTFRGPSDVERFGLLLEEVESGVARRLAFVVPWGAAWVLPAYELALMTAARVRGLDEVEIALVTPEAEPLQLFGAVASATVQDLLDERGITVHLRSAAESWKDGELTLAGGTRLVADRVVALPRLYGERLQGIPHTVDGFIPVDDRYRVRGLDRVFAAGDVTDYPVKQGGIACEQARVAAEAIAVLAGENIVETPFHPVLRGMLLTGSRPQYFRKDITDDNSSWATTSPIWWPPTKVVGRYLAPTVASLVPGAGVASTPDVDGVTVEMDLGELEPPVVERLAIRRFELAERDDAPNGGSRTVADVMRTDLLTIAPEDSIGELAGRMRERDLGSALVTEYGRLIGIVTTRDLLRALEARMHSSEARVRQWMTADPVTVGRDTPTQRAGELMAEYGIHHLPVVDRDRPVGMIGLRDVASR